jgi:nitroreductase
VGENTHLQAVALDLATVEVGAFRDEEVRGILGVEEQIRPLYIMPVGYVRAERPDAFDR